MKAAAAVVLVCVAFTLCVATPFDFSRQSFFSDERLAMVDAINRDDKLTWKATADNRFANASLAEIKMLMGTLDDNYDHPDVEYVFHELTDLPENFDPREQWPGYIGAIRDQQHCGSCWAFGAAEAFSDRLAIHTKGALKLVLSPEDLVSCAPFPDMGCNGGIPYFAWHHIKAVGVVSDSCFPYTAGDGNAPKCATSCSDGSDFVRHKVSKFFHVKGEANIMAELAANGPLEGAFSVYEDFMTYKSGVYTHTTGSMLGGHAIKILGWGVENGVKYWLCANSWGTSWGENGTFKIRRGTNEVGIEATVYGGTPVEDHVSVQIDADAVKKFFKGFVKSFAGMDIPDMSKCVTEPVRLISDMKNAFEDLKKHTIASLADALDQLKDASDAMLKGLEECQAAEEEVVKMYDVVRTLDTPSKVFSHILEQAKLHGKDIMQEAVDALNKFKQKKFEDFGSDAGAILAQLIE